jgi:hypothetical protein
MRLYSSKPGQKGGTLIAEDVLDLAAHELRLLDPDGYRPLRCPRCGHGVLHAHDSRLRTPRDQPHGTSILIRRYVCAAEGCAACWQVLPAFLARHLQRAWATIESVSLSEATTVAAPTPPPPVPASTARRYRSRLASCASALRAALAAVGAGVDAVLSRLDEAVTRAGFCRALSLSGFVDPSRRLASLAAWLHRLVPGLRLM